MGRFFWRSQTRLTELAKTLGVPLSIDGGTDDEKSAYRWKPVCADHLRFSNIAFFDRRVGRVRFITLHGHAFGLAAAALNYNRQPELLVAVMRCLLETSCLHFYDDHLTLEPSTAQGSGQWAYRELCKLLNVHLDEDKHSPMSSRPASSASG